MGGSASRMIRVLTFAGARDVVGASEIDLDIDTVAADGCTAGRVMDWLCERYPELVSRRPIIRLAVNGTYVNDEHPVAAGDEVALIPPVAGG